MMKASAIANANIALVKYWGKRNRDLMLPQNSSISVNIDGVFSHTTVEFNKKYEEDIFILNDRKYKKETEEYDEYIKVFLNFVRKIFKINLGVKIVSKNNFPSSAGLASSAAGFAALATAINKAIGLGLNPTELSILARHGSGSATRSIFGGFVEWQKGEREDGSDSFAAQLAPPKYWPDFRIVICLVQKEEKKVKSRAGMEQTVKSSPYYNKWIETIEEDLRKVRKGIAERNFTLVGKTAEENCLKMHATMITTIPPILYWNAKTIKIIHSIWEWREGGLSIYFTIDAGPQVKILCLEKDLKLIEKKLEEIKIIDKVIITKPGKGAIITEKNLF